MKGGISVSWGGGVACMHMYIKSNYQFPDEASRMQKLKRNPSGNI